MENINTKENWNKYHKITKLLLNYPDKFKFISKLLNLKPNSKVLEIGCGMGILLKQIKLDHPDFIIEGIDFSEVAVDYVNSIGIKASVGVIPFCLKNYKPEWDAIIGTEILEHLDEKDRFETLKEIYRILTPKGKAIFSVPDNVLPPSEERFHLICYKKKTFDFFLHQVFNLCGVVQKKFLPSNNPYNKLWSECPFLIGICYKY